MTTPTTPLDSDAVLRLVGELGAVDGAGVPDAQRVDLVAALERLKAGAAAAQARVTHRLAASQRELAGARTMEARAASARSVSGMIGLARRESPHRGNTYLGLASALVEEMPHTLAALTAGEISEFRALVLVRETAVLTQEHRTEVDARLAPVMARLGVRRLGNAARSVGYELDPGSALRRTRGAEADRRVTIRPAPDTMVWLSALLPVTQGVAAYAALKKHAATLRATGDQRSEGQLMADALAARVSGAVTVEKVPVTVNVVMGEAAVFGHSDAPCWVAGYGPVPTGLARTLVRKAERAWIRRLYADPSSGRLAAADTRRRPFPASVRTAAVAVDDVCATPWCDAPVKHADHVTRHADGGPSTRTNHQGLCETCNYRKEQPGWTTSKTDDQVCTTTPTGHIYSSRPPPLPGTEQTRVIHIAHGPPLHWRPVA